MVERSVLPSKFVVALTFVVAFGFQASTASAQTVPGSWNVTFYLEPGHATGATQCVIFLLGPAQVGEPLSGRWRATTFAGWNGHWIKEGDHIRCTARPTPSPPRHRGVGPPGVRHAHGGEFVHFSSDEGQTSTSGAWIATRRLTVCPALSSEVAPEDGADPALGQ